MRLIPLRLAFAGVVALGLNAHLPLRAQPQSPPAAAPLPADTLKTLEQRIDRLTDALAAAERQMDEDHRTMQALRLELEELRKNLPGGGAGSDEQANATAVGQLQQAVTQMRDEQDVIAAEVKQHEQTKLESASKFPVRLHGLVLFNAFVNEGAVDQLDMPTAALLRIPGQSHGSVGAGVRQTVLDFEGTGPLLGKGRLSADASLDFFGGVTAGICSLRHVCLLPSIFQWEPSDPDNERKHHFCAR